MKLIKNNRVQKHLKKKKRGFTLIEAVVVIGILLIAGMMARPYFSEIKEEQRQANYKSDIESISAVALHFTGENGLHALGDTSKGVVISNEDLGEITETDTVIPVDPDRTEFTTSDDEVVSLLVPITDKHPLVTMGYLTKAPENPWEGDSRLGSSSKSGEEFSYTYVIDYKVTKKLKANPDGSRDQSSKVMPVVKLMRMDKDNNLHRDDFIVVTNGKALRTGEPKDTNQIKNNALKDSLRIYGFDFKNKTSGADNDEQPLWKHVINQ